MQAEAITKLRSEINRSNNPAVQVIGQFLLQHLEQNPEDAGTILQTDKTIAKSLEAMRKAAEKKKVGSMAVLTDAEGFAIVLDYYKSEAPVEEAPKPAAAPKTKGKKAPDANEPVQADPSDDDFDFDDLLK